MIRKYRTYIMPWLLLPLLYGTAGGDEGVFKAGEHGSSSLRLVQGTPLLTLCGTPEEMGEAHGRLVGEGGNKLIELYLVPVSAMMGGLDKLTARAMQMESQVPERYRREMKALAKAMGKDYGQVLTGVAFPDVYRGGGCSTLAADGTVTKGKEPLLARNLDFFPMGVLQKYGLVAVYRPEGYHAFVSVTWPTLCGVLSGMNDRGLCCAVMEVRSGVRRWHGMPSVLLFRRIMEEAATVEEGLKILKEARKVAANNLILMDASGDAAVAEIGPGRFKIRLPTGGVVFSTNHHREGRSPVSQCRRYHILTRFADAHRGRIDVDLLKEVLHDVNQGILSVQSMIFAPATRTLHLSMGMIPASAGEYKVFDFAEAFKEEAASPPSPKKKGLRWLK